MLGEIEVMNELENRGGQWFRAEDLNFVGRRSRRPELARIGTHLRSLYEEAAEDPLPERFTRLLARLDEHRA
jgi:hypothetical protein